MKTLGVASVVALVALASGCAATTDPSAPTDVADGELDSKQIVYSTNADGTWSENAATPQLNVWNSVRAYATFTGPTGKVRKMGVCTLRLTDTACSGLDSVDPVTGYGGPCASLYLAPGGYRYCTAPNGSGQKYCALRDGDQSVYCGGSPSYADHHAIAPGTYYAPYHEAESLTSYISYACFEGCSATDPSSSSARYNTWDCSASPQYCFKYYPSDPYCGGACPNGDA
jgi:hypothetical protein